MNNDFLAGSPVDFRNRIIEISIKVVAGRVPIEVPYQVTAPAETAHMAKKPAARTERKEFFKNLLAKTRTRSEFKK